MKIDAAQVTQSLSEEGLKVKSDDSGIWSLSFEINARKQPAYLVWPDDDAPYFLAVSPITSDRLNSPLESLSAPVLRLLFKLQSCYLLAKIHYVTLPGDVSRYVAVSPCSVESWTGGKLGRRLESCAQLAASTRAALLDLGADS